MNTPLRLGLIRIGVALLLNLAVIRASQIAVTQMSKWRGRHLLNAHAGDRARGRSKSTRLANIGESHVLGLSGILRQSGGDRWSIVWRHNRQLREGAGEEKMFSSLSLRGSKSISPGRTSTKNEIGSGGGGCPADACVYLCEASC